MEKYSQFRDKGTAIAPFLPIPAPATSPLWAPLHLTLFLIRFPALLFLSTFYFAILEHLPLGSFPKKCVLWLILAVPGVWWVDLQVDGVKRGKLSEKQGYLPGRGSVIASSFTSPLDAIYLAGIFCPVFVKTWPGERRVQQLSLFGAISLAFSKPQVQPPDGAKLTTLSELKERYPEAVICVFPECTTTNGRGILPFSPALVTADKKTKIYPVSLRYTPGDITTPVPGGVLGWVWKLCSKPTHCIRVRIARPVYNDSTPDASRLNGTGSDMGFETNVFDSPHMRNGMGGDGEGEDGGVTREEQKLLDHVAEDLARLGRVKRVGLGVREKIEFVKVWTSRKR